MSRVRDEDLPLLEQDFSKLPESMKWRIYGVDYARLMLDKSGEFFVTRWGWQRFPNILPDNWYSDRKYYTLGERLNLGTGAVYRVPTFKDGRPLDLLVKFSRFGESVPMTRETFPKDVPPEVAESAHWNDPFEEFGALNDLRRARFGTPNLRIITERPLGIYNPSREYAAWQLGRSHDLVEQHNKLLEEELRAHHLPEDLHIHEKRQYILIYEWLKGEDAEQFFLKGKLTQKEMDDLNHRVVAELHDKGFRVLDNKPRHFILRELPDGTLMRRNGKLVYGLVDFELLIRTREYAKHLHLKHI